MNSGGQHLWCKRDPHMQASPSFVTMVVRFRWPPLTWGVVHDSGLLSCLTLRQCWHQGYLAWWTWRHQSVDVYHWHHWIPSATGPELFAAAAERLLLDSGRQTVAKWFGFSPFLHSLPRAWALISWLVLTVLPQYPQRCISPSCQCLPVFVLPVWLQRLPPNDFRKTTLVLFEAFSKFVSIVISTKKREWNSRVGVILGDLEPWGITRKINKFNQFLHAIQLFY